MVATRHRLSIKWIQKTTTTRRRRRSSEKMTQKPGQLHRATAIHTHIHSQASTNTPYTRNAQNAHTIYLINFYLFLHVKRKNVQPSFDSISRNFSTPLCWLLIVVCDLCRCFFSSFLVFHLFYFCPVSCSFFFQVYFYRKGDVSLPLSFPSFLPTFYIFSSHTKNKSKHSIDVWRTLQ